MKVIPIKKPGIDPKRVCVGCPNQGEGLTPKCAIKGPCIRNGGSSNAR